MCGITGFWDIKGKFSSSELRTVITNMTDILSHRGPDSGEVYIDQNLALGHRRLAIIDLSPAGYQPMASACGRYILVFNGEVYNSAAIRSELDHLAIKWRGHSDTETILESFAHIGIQKTLEKMIGMFALALWDKQERRLVLMRDRFGVKPLYWRLVNQQLSFASELKSLLQLPNFERCIRRDAQYDFLHTGYIYGEKTIWESVYKLLPGHILVLNQNDSTPKIEPYYDVRSVWGKGQSAQTNEREDNLIESLHELLIDAVKQRMISDVPLGAFLSGGIDSSLVTALMQSQSNQPVKSFTIGFENKQYNEAPYARDVARHLGTDHTEVILTDRDALDVIPLLSTIYDEPFADSSQIPTYLVSKVARTKVTVSLSGDGGDEFFGGYSRYIDGINLYNTLNKIPNPLKNLGYWCASHLSEDILNRVGDALPSRHFRNGKLSERTKKLGAVLQDNTIDTFYGQMIAHEPDPNRLLNTSVQSKHYWQDHSLLPPLSDNLVRMQLYDACVYLPDDILTKVDRASMAVSLESREPLLDHRLVEFASRLPAHMKIRNGQGKYLLRQVLYKYVPAPLIDRPKMGFGIPLASWLRGPLREWAEDLLDSQSLVSNEFNPVPIRKKWSQHIEGKVNWDFILWDILMYQSWARRWN
jgi:asparagine synthase (glutamine-hydrolysing)